MFLGPEHSVCGRIVLDDVEFDHHLQDLAHRRDVRHRHVQLATTVAPAADTDTVRLVAADLVVATVAVDGEVTRGVADKLLGHLCAATGAEGIRQNLPLSRGFPRMLAIGNTTTGSAPRGVPVVMVPSKAG